MSQSIGELWRTDTDKEARGVATAVTPGASSSPPHRRMANRPMRFDPAGMFGTVLLLLIGLACLAAPLLTPADPTAVNLTDQFLPPGPAHPLGTDAFGRDLLARLLYGGRLSLAVAATATVVVLVISLGIGMTAGYLGGLVDGTVMRLVDLILAFPRLVLAIALAGALGAGLLTVTFAIIAVSWAWYARLVRGMTLQLREEQYVLAARAVGATTPRLLGRHLLPGLGGRVAVLVSLDFGYLVLSVSALSYLGLGVQPPTPEWGAMLNEGRVYFAQHPQLMLYPGLAIFMTVLSANMVGDAVRDALDPRRR